MAGVIQVSRLGSFGRFGNQLFQYCAAKAIARSRGAELQVPSTWIGRLIFDISDPPIVAPFAPTPGCDPRLDEIGADADLWGYFQNPEYYALYSRSDAREWLRLKPQWRHLGREVKCAAHFRSYKGYESHYCVVAQESYEDAARAYGLPDFEMVSDVRPARMPGLNDEIGFLHDWLTLCKADVLMRGNSTFSIWAAWLGAAKIVYAPVVDALVGGPHRVEFREGNHWPIMDFARNCPGELGRVYGDYLLSGESQ